MKLVALFIFVACYFSAGSIFAHTDTIRYGLINFNDVYDPSSLSVSVGDTIIWDGDLTFSSFIYHPLESTSRPAGADTIGMNTGSIYKYVIKVAGVYHYQCHIHYAMGMTGTITAVKAAVKPDENNTLSAQNFPNPFATVTTIRYELNAASPIDLKIFDLTGKQIYNFGGFQNTGSHELNFDGSNLPSGNYLYQLRAGNAVLNRRMLITR